MKGMASGTVKLKNGSEESSALVSVTMFILKDLIAKKPIALYKLIQLCQDPEHKLFGNATEVLKSYALIMVAETSDGNIKVHDSVRNIVLSAIEGDGMDITLVSSFAESAGLRKQNDQ